MSYHVYREENYRINNLEIKKIVVRFFKLFKVSSKKDFSLVFVSLLTMKKLNYQYRKKKKPTDVLSFSEADTADGLVDKNFLGEIVICYDYAVDQAKRKKRLIADEINQLLVHGLLHLIGQDHQTLSDEQKMMRQEEKILQTKFYKWEVE